LASISVGKRCTTARAVPLAAGPRPPLVPAAEIAAELRLRATKRQKAGMNGESARSRDETGLAVQSAFRAIRRKSLAPR
jgi:hypothetical protein